MYCHCALWSIRRLEHCVGVDALRETLSASRLCQPDSWIDCSVDQLAELYSSELTSLLDSLIPARTVAIRRRPSDPWFDQECRQTKRVVRRLERSARLRCTPEATAAWYSQRREYPALLRRKCERFWCEKIDAEKSTPCQLWRSVDALLGRSRVPPLDDIGAEQFHRYFDDKVAGVRSAMADAPPPSFSSTSFDASFRQFHHVTVDEVTAVVRALPDKSCALDPLPTAQFKAVVDIIALFLTELFNRSLASGFVPEVFKAAYITPLLKKSDMDPADVPTDFQPVGRVHVAGATRGTPAIGLPQQVWPASAASVCIPLRPLVRDRRVEGPVGHPACHRLRRLICIGVAGSICGLRHGGSTF